MSNKRCATFASIADLIFMLFIGQAAALSEGYIVCGAYAGRSTVLLDKKGDVIHTWKHDSLIDTLNGYSCYLLKNGNLLRTAQYVTNKKITGAMPWQGAINEVDPWGKTVWRYVLSNDTFTLHHDIKPMPNGNVLATAFMVQTKEQMIAAGVDTNLLKFGVKFILSEKIIEIKPKYPEGGDIVWQWVMFDHVVPKEQAAAHPELISGSIVNGLYNQTQWVHLNGLDYCPLSDLIVFSSRVFSELYVIDHGTTTQQAAGHTGGKRGKGGDILYRWGKPSNYGATGATINVLHCPNWIPQGYPGAGHIIFFHNNEMAGKSEVIEIAPAVDGDGNFTFTPGQAFGPDQPAWKFSPGDSMNSFAMSSAFRMRNGNTLAHESYPRGNVMDTSACSVLWEITPDKQVVWKYALKVRSGMEEGLSGFGKMSYNPAKIMYYPDDYEGISNLFLRLAAQHSRTGPSQATGLLPMIRFNRRASRIDFFNIAGCTIRIYSLSGKQLAAAKPRSDSYSVNTERLQRGIYLIVIEMGFDDIINETITII